MSHVLSRAGCAIGVFIWSSAGQTTVPSEIPLVTGPHTQINA